jgi:diaminohydroxyphosphoribosylaminopyrimidine deaminase/5-amino-6-(5-phosphoribosylamino)uracil reductase
MFIKKNKNSRQSYFMNLALMQARRSLGNTKNNPAVGCVIVKDNVIVSVGNTGFNGTPHAEKNAIFFNKKKIKNSTLYSSLEPCSNYGKTPPCVKLIIKYKIKKVFFSINDPDKRSYNKAKKEFKKAKIFVKSNINRVQSNLFYKSYIKSKNKGLPFVTAKIAISKDLFTINKKEKWITNKYSRGRVHLLRSNHDCLLTTSNTIINDNPDLSCRINGLEHTSPARIILDKNLRIPLNSKIIKTAKKKNTIIFYNKQKLFKQNLLKNFGVKLYKISLDESDNFILIDVLRKIKSFGFSRIFLESGTRLTEAFLKNYLIEDFHLFVSNKILANNGKNNFRKGLSYLKNCKEIIKVKVNLLGDEMISYRLK